MFIVYNEGSTILLNSKEIVKISVEYNSLRAYLASGEVSLLQSDESEDNVGRFNDIVEAISSNTALYDCTKPIGSWNKKSPGRPKKTESPKKEE